MNFSDLAAPRPGYLRAALAAGGLSLTLTLGTPVPAGADAEPSAPPLVIGNDRGGPVRDRLRQIAQLRRSGRPVQIRGRVCFSTCTMFLGLPQTCISPATTFGFHGPSLRGRPLPRDQFDYYSRVIAQYYPEPLRLWYMETGRTRLIRIFHVSGADIVAMGVPACRDP